MFFRKAPQGIGMTLRLTGPESHIFCMTFRILTRPAGGRPRAGRLEISDSNFQFSNFRFFIFLCLHVDQHPPKSGSDTWEHNPSRGRPQAGQGSVDFKIWKLRFFIFPFSFLETLRTPPLRTHRGLQNKRIIRISETDRAP